MGRSFACAGSRWETGTVAPLSAGSRCTSRSCGAGRRQHEATIRGVRIPARERHRISASRKGWSHAPRSAHRGARRARARPGRTGRRANGARAVRLALAAARHRPGGHQRPPRGAAGEYDPPDVRRRPRGDRGPRRPQRRRRAERRSRRHALPLRRVRRAGDRLHPRHERLGPGTGTARRHSRRAGFQRADRPGLVLDRRRAPDRGRRRLRFDALRHQRGGRGDQHHHRRAARGVPRRRRPARWATATCASRRATASWASRSRATSRATPTTTPRPRSTRPERAPTPTRRRARRASRTTRSWGTT